MGRWKSKGNFAGKKNYQKEISSYDTGYCMKRRLLLIGIEARNHGRAMEGRSCGKSKGFQHPYKIR